MHENRNPDTSANLESVVKDALADQVKGKFGYQAVRVHCHSVRKRPTDTEAVSIKAALDGIVEAGVLADDNSEIVKEVTFSQEKGDNEKTVITITGIAE